MRAEPISILLNENFIIDKKIYFISGNEKTLMQKIKATIVEKCQLDLNARITNIDTIKDFVAKEVKNDKGIVTSYADVIKVLKDVNGQSIDTASGLANRVTSTTNGALVDLGGGNTILLEGVNSSDLSAANFQVVEVL